MTTLFLGAACSSQACSLFALACKQDKAAVGFGMATVSFLVLLEMSEFLGRIF